MARKFLRRFSVEVKRTRGRPRKNQAAGTVVPSGEISEAKKQEQIALANDRLQAFSSVNDVMDLLDAAYAALKERARLRDEKAKIISVIESAKKYKSSFLPTDELREIVFRSACAGLRRSDVLALAGVSEAVFSRHFFDEYSVGRASAALVVTTSLMRQALSGDVKAQSKFLDMSIGQSLVIGAGTHKPDSLKILIGQSVNESSIITSTS